MNMAESNNKIDVSIVIPVYNEELILKKQIENIVNELDLRLKGSYEIIIVENGSTDRTLQICNQFKKYQKYQSVRVESMSLADYGAALRKGMLSSRGKIIVNYDLDYYDISFLLQALALEPFGYDVIVASKNIKLSKDKRKFIRRLISSFYKYVLFYGFGLQVSDTHGIKAWRNDNKFRELIAETVSNKEIFDTELIIRSQYAGRKLLELPTRVIEMRKSVSSILKRASRGSAQIMKLWFRFNILERNRVEATNCPICNSKKHKQRSVVDNFRVIKCLNCGLVRIDHGFSFGEIKSLYQNNYFENPDYSVGYIDYVATEQSLRMNFRKRAREIIKSANNKDFSLLDVGTSTGFFVSECLKLGIKTEGIEVSQEAVKFARQNLKLDVHKTTLEEFNNRKKYNVISAWDVIEHSAYPNKFLKKVSSFLYDDGKFYFTTGDIDSLCARISGRRWHLFNLPDHLFFYSKKTIARLLDKNGLRVKSISYPWNYYELGYLIERFLKKIIGIKNVKVIRFLSYNKVTRKIIIPFNLFDIMKIEAVSKSGEKAKIADKEYFYENIATDFEKVMNSYEVEKRKNIVFKELLNGSLKNKSFLDAGCGIGIFSALAEKKGAKVTSLDVGESLLKEAAKRSKSKKVAGLVTDLPFKNDSFDVVLATEVLEHTSNPAKGFDELVRVTKPGGQVVITVPNRIWLPSVYVADALRIRPYQGLENWLWWSQIKKWAKKNDLVIEKMSGFNIIPMFYSPFYKFIDFMDRFGNFAGPLMVNIAISAKKKRI